MGGRHYTRYIIYLLFCMIIQGCAQFGAPLGGPKDETPPKIIQENSTPNYQTNFDQSQIQIEFDEWIKVNNPLKEVVVSPPTDFPFVVEERGKTVFFKFSENEVLKEDATYQINFGKSIQDFTEGNVYENLIYIFSTGDVIDSLSLRGKVQQAIDGKAAQEVLVVLYDDLSDTCFTATRPFYFTRTDAEGNFTLNNIKSDTFQIFTLKDENVNYYYDLSREQVGFYDSLIYLTDTAAYTDIELEIFDEFDPTRIIENIQNENGLLKVVMNQYPKNYSLIPSDDSLTTYNYIENDTLYVWYNGMLSDIIIESEEITDTIKIKKVKKNIADRALVLPKGFSRRISVYRRDSMTVSFNKPLSRIDTSLVILSDTAQSYNISNYYYQNLDAHFFFDGLIDTSSYTLTLLPNAITDIYNKKNVDTLEFSVATKNSKELGNFIFNITNEDGGFYYFTLLKADEVIAEFSVNENIQKKISKLEPGAYTLNIIEDLDRNEKWSPGNVIEKRHSERRKEITLKELTAGWDQELDVDIKEIFDGTTSQ